MGKPVIISGPVASGKTIYAEMLIKILPGISVMRNINTCDLEFVSQFDNLFFDNCIFFHQIKSVMERLLELGCRAKVIYFLMQTDLSDIKTDDYCILKSYHRR